MEVIEIDSESTRSSEVETLPTSSKTEQYEIDSNLCVSKGDDSDSSLPPFYCNLVKTEKSRNTEITKTPVKVTCHTISSSEDSDGDEVSVVYESKAPTIYTEPVDPDLPLAERLKLKYQGVKKSSINTQLDGILSPTKYKHPELNYLPDLKDGNSDSDGDLIDEYHCSDTDEVSVADTLFLEYPSNIDKVVDDKKGNTLQSLPKPNTKAASKKRKSLDNEKKLEREAKKLKKAEEQAAKKALQEERKRLREEKKLEKQKEALLKSVETNARRNQKPGECLKFIQAILDPRILEVPGTANILTLFQTAELKYKIEQQPMPYCIVWSREVNETTLNEQMQPETIVKEVIEDELMVYIPREKFITLVEGTRQEQKGLSGDKTLISFVHEIEAVYPMKKITLLIQGLKQYYRNINTAKNRKFRAAVLGKGSSKLPSKEYSIKQIDVEESLVALQVQENVNAVQLETGEEVASTICSFTKAIAEAPFKKKKYHMQGFSWYAAIDSRNCIRVKDSGEGIKDLWIQQLAQFNMATKEIALAIAVNYPTPQNLLQAYKDCANTKEAETLLQDIPTRRGAGPLSKRRRLGPELSRKIYLAMTSYNPDLNLNAT